MSSLASQRAMLAALGGMSIAALFVWYLRSQNADEKAQQRSEVTRELLTSENGIKNSARKNTETNGVQAKAAEPVSSEKVNKTSDSQNVEKTNVAAEKNGTDSKTSVASAPRNNSEEVHDEIAENESVNASNELAEKESIETTLNMAPMETTEHSSISEEFVIKEQSPRKKTSELILDCSTHTLLENEKVEFLWAEEMERSYAEQAENDRMNQATYTESGSPASSEDSMGSSQDSGRATGGLASSLSPMDDCNDGLPMYEFEIPNSLVGLIIGVKGKTIKELSTRTDVKMLIRPHHAPEKSDSHQICQVRGKRDQINKCLQMLRRRFPNERFPELNLQPVLPPILPTSLFDALTGQPSWLSLPENVSCEVVCSSITDPGHFFVQQPTHPSFPSLAVLDRYMLILYSSGTSIPELPKPCQNGLLCAAPVLGAWFRAVTVAYYEEPDEVLVRFVDYGGYETIPRGDLRQIRTDLMSLPFQATECHLAHVQPIDGTSQWPEESLQFFHEICMGKIVIATVVGTHVEDKMPMVEIVINSGDDGKAVRLDEALMSAGFAKASDPSKMSRFSVKRPSFNAQQSTVMVS
ncbi:unnamed protein product [Auanema sp. JU1783]|nr:unnamed protein product [Auanema sp. JU1783]